MKFYYIVYRLKYRKYFSRSFLDSCLSHALNIPLNDKGRISRIDEKKFVMTPDSLVMVLNIHERKKCGVPVIISSETGVGKTFIIEMVAALWNESLLNSMNIKRSSLVDLLTTKLQCLSDPDSCPVKSLTPADRALVSSVLATFSSANSLSISFDSLFHALLLSDPHEPSQPLYQLFCSRLLDEQYDPLFSLVAFPDKMPDDRDIMHLFELLTSRDVSFITF